MSEDLFLGEKYTTFKVLIKLFNLFEDDDYESENDELKEDIEESIKIISMIEITERKRKAYHTKYGLKEQKYKGFNQKHVRILDSIMVKSPLTVGVGFESDHSSRKISNSKIVEDFLSRALENVISSQRKKGLPDLSLCLDVQEISFDDDKDVRNILTYGLFYYANQLIGDDFLRPRRCSCKKWFLPLKNDQLSCSTKCKNARRSKFPKRKKVLLTA